MFASVLSLISPDPSPAAAAQRQIDVFSDCETNQKLILLSSVELLTVFFFFFRLFVQTATRMHQSTRDTRGSSTCTSTSPVRKRRRVWRSEEHSEDVKRKEENKSAEGGKKNVKRNCNQAINEGEGRRSRQAAAWFFVYLFTACVFSVLLLKLYPFLLLYLFPKLCVSIAGITSKLFIQMFSVR